MTRSKLIGYLGVTNLILTFLFLGSVVLFSFNDSEYHSKEYANFSRQLYGLGLAILGALIVYVSMGKEELNERLKDISYSSKQETILDDEPSQESDLREKGEGNFALVFGGIHIVISLFLALGGYLGYSYAILQTLGFVYGILIIVICLNFIPMIKGKPFAGN